MTGNLTPTELSKVARRVQEDLLELPGISRANIEGGRRFEIAIEAEPEKLLAYDLTFHETLDHRRVVFQAPLRWRFQIGGRPQYWHD